MNTKIYHQAHELATQMVEAQEKNNQRLYDQYYSKLEKLCSENEKHPKKNHPMQWETLADLTQDSVDAMPIYEKALSLAIEQEEIEYCASICYAIAVMKKEEQDQEQANNYAQQALEYSEGLEDTELTNEIKSLIAQMKLA